MRAQLSFLLDDVGIPKCYRTMPGFGVHAFKMLARDGRETFVKFHWKPKQGEYFCGLFYVSIDGVRRTNGVSGNQPDTLKNKTQ